MSAVGHAALGILLWLVVGWLALLGLLLIACIVITTIETVRYRRTYPGAPFVRVWRYIWRHS